MESQNDPLAFYHTSIYISKSFRPTWEKIRKWAEESMDPDFIDYCRFIEGVNITKLRRSKTSMYISFILSKYVAEKEQGKD